MAPAVILFVLLLAINATVQVSGTAVHIYVKPTHPSSNNITCPDKDHGCVMYTLDQLNANSSFLLPRGGNVTIKLLQGVHRLYKHDFPLRDFNSLTIESASNKTPTIQYFGRGFFFDIRNATIVVIRKIHFFGDGSSKIKLKTTSEFLLEDVQMTCFVVNIIPVFSGDITANLVNCSFVKSSFKVGEDFVVKHMYVSIVNCTFSQFESVPYAIKIYAKKNFMSNFNTLTMHFTKLTITDTLSLNHSAISIKLLLKNLTSHSKAFIYRSIHIH